MKLHPFLRLRPLLRVVGLGLILPLSLFQQIAATPVNFEYATRGSLNTKRPFRLLILGDSVLWGQGLRNEHKFSYKLKDWICAQRNNGSCPNPDDVDIYVEAHSGAVVAQPRGSSEKKEEQRFIRKNSPVKYPGEVNHGYPTIWGQVDLARRHYEQLSIPLEQVDLILVNGGINDTGATKILLPLIGGNLEQFAKKYCQDEMKLLLDKLASTFPNARIIVPGYFPLVSVSTPENILFETIGYLFLHKKEKANQTSAIELATANPAGPTPEASTVLRSLAKRSLQWTAASNANLAFAVKSFNSTHSSLTVVNPNGQPSPPGASMRALFVAVPFRDDNAYAAPQSFLWKLVPKPSGVVFECAEHDALKRLMVSDELQTQRPCMCDQAGKGNDIACVRAGAFHPNIEGAAAYFQAISTQMEKIWQVTGWATSN